MASSNRIGSLDYAREHPGYVSRRRCRLLHSVILFNLIGSCGVWFGPAIVRNIQAQLQVRAQFKLTQQAKQRSLAQKQTQLAQKQIQLAQQQQWLDFSLPPGTVVYEEDPIAIKQLLGASSDGFYSPAGDLTVDEGPAPPTYWRGPIARCAPGSWEAVPDKEFYHHGSHLAFLHAMTSPSGHVRLVWVGFQGGCFLSKAPSPSYDLRNYTLEYQNLVFVASVFVPMTMDNDMRRVWYEYMQVAGASAPGSEMLIQWDTRAAGDAAVSFANGRKLRVFAGQVDPKDPSHFTMEFSLHDQKSAIDAWLLDDDRLRMEPRIGKLNGESVRDYKHRFPFNSMTYGWDPDVVDEN